MIKDILDYEKAYATPEDLQQIAEELQKRDTITESLKYKVTLAFVTAKRTEGQDSASDYRSLKDFYLETAKIHEDNILAIKKNIRSRYKAALIAAGCDTAREHISEIIKSITVKQINARVDILNHLDRFKLEFFLVREDNQVEAFRDTFIDSQGFDENIIFGRPSRPPTFAEWQTYSRVLERELIIDTLIDYCGAELQALEDAGEDIASELEKILQKAKYLYWKLKGSLYPTTATEKPQEGLIDVRQGTIEQALTRVKSNTRKLKYEEKDKAWTITPTRQAQLLFSTEEEARSFSPLALMVYDIIQQKAYKTRSDQVIINIKEYAALRGLKDTKEAKKQLIKVAAFLSEIRARVEEKGFKPLKPSEKPNVYEEPLIVNVPVEINRGEISLQIPANIYNSLLTLSKPLFIDPKAFKINSKLHPYAYHLYKYFCDYYRTNTSKPKQKNKLKVTTILKYIDLPHKADVNRKYRERIIDPLENELNYLQDMQLLKSWHYYDNEEDRIIDLDRDRRTMKELERWYLVFELEDEQRQAIDSQALEASERHGKILLKGGNDADQNPKKKTRKKKQN